jgi:hypothetical protein
VRAAGPEHEPRGVSGNGAVVQASKEAVDVLVGGCSRYANKVIEGEQVCRDPRGGWSPLITAAGDAQPG